MPLLRSTANGLYCEAGDFYLDPWRPVDRAIITHAHSDHARWGSKSYLTSDEGVDLLRIRLSPDSLIQSIPYGKTISERGVSITLYPAGHVLGSSQVLVEHQGERWIFTGDYKLGRDPTCAQFESVKCHIFISESTFGMPIYQWRNSTEIFSEINEWWRSCVENGRSAIIYAYSLGKAQRVLAGIDPTIGKVILHGAIKRHMAPYVARGIKFPEFSTHEKKAVLAVAPPSVAGTPWMKKFAPYETASVSGWAAVRGIRRRSGNDRGFVLSDHADWPELWQAIRESGASSIGVTHGYVETMVRALNESGLNAWPLKTEYSNEDELDKNEADEEILPSIS